MLMEAAMTAERLAPALAQTSPDVPKANPQPLPFEEAFIHFRRYVRPQLRTLSPWISESAARDLEDDIIFWLSRVCGQTLHHEFNTVNPERDQYDQFILDLRHRGWTRLRRKYPALDHLIEGVLARKLDEAREFATRLEADWYELSKHMGSRRGLVRRIQSSLSAPHQGMRSVKALEFDSGQRVVYKPKNIGMQVAWSELCQWTGERIGLELKQPRVLNRNTHGWMELVRPEPCSNDAELSRYHRRAGALVCLLYALRGTDHDLENLVPRGEYPFLIDADTQFQPDSEIAGQPPSTSAIVNAEMLAGFEQTYRMLVEHKEELVSERGPLKAFQVQPVRIGLRNVRDYQEALDRALHPNCLVDEKTFRSSFDELTPELPTPLRQAASAALAALDIPAFFVGCDSTSLLGVEGLLRCSGYEAVKRRIAHLDENDLLGSVDARQCLTSHYT